MGSINTKKLSLNPAIYPENREDFLIPKELISALKNNNYILNSCT
jgi:hypothetical protein